MKSPSPERKAAIILSVEPASIAWMALKSRPRLKQAYLNMAIGWPPWSTMTFLPFSLSQVKAGSGLRPVRKKPSFSLIWAKCTAGGCLPCSSGVKPWLGADCATCTEPSSRPAIADFPGAETECLASSPSVLRKPPAMVAISGE